MSVDYRATKSCFNCDKGPGIRWLDPYVEAGCDLEVFVRLVAFPLSPVIK